MDVKPIKKKSTVTIKTFKKWSFSSDFNAEVDEHGDIISLTCKICHDNLAERSEISWIQGNSKRHRKLR